MGVGGAAGRLIKLRQRERRAQFETPRLLLLRNRDGGEQGFLDRHGVRRIALPQNVAADAMRFRRAPALPVPLDFCDDAVDGCERGVGFACLRFRFRQQGCKKRDEQADCLLAASRDTVAHFGDGSGRAVRITPRPRCQEFA